MRKSLIILCVLLAVVGCRPRDILSNREMREVLYDLHRADGAIQVAGYNYSHDKEVAGYYKNVLDDHGITQAQFDSSLVWYTDNPQIFNKIYPKVLARLEADFEEQVKIREANRDKVLTQRNQKKKAATCQIPAIEDIMDQMHQGYKNPWKLWVPEEFCEKNVVIFGQLEKK